MRHFFYTLNKTVYLTQIKIVSIIATTYTSRLNIYHALLNLARQTTCKLLVYWFARLALLRSPSSRMHHLVQQRHKYHKAKHC